jgi:hypothetical protein
LHMLIGTECTDAAREMGTGDGARVTGHSLT